jgi:hypothetical protein
MGFSDLLKDASGILTGGLGGLAESVVDVVSGQFPDKMSEAEKAELTAKIKEIEHKKEIELMQAWNEQEKGFQKFINEHEGSASDLKSIPILGPIMLFLRGAFRPIMAFGVLYTDMMVFSGSWNIAIMAGTIAPQVMSLLWLINIIILTFYFGERAMKNLAPLIEKVFAKTK